jgi:hypothetical protein
LKIDLDLLQRITKVKKYVTDFDGLENALVVPAPTRARHFKVPQGRNEYKEFVLADTRKLKSSCLQRNEQKSSGI